MGVARVKQCQKIKSEATEEIEYCLVGYINFKFFSDENEKMLPLMIVPPKKEQSSEKTETIGTTEQLIVKITKPKNDKNEYK